MSEVEDYNLDGMRVGPVVTGEIGPFSSVRLDIIWQPTIPGKVDSEFLVTFADPLSEGVRAAFLSLYEEMFEGRKASISPVCPLSKLKVLSNHQK